MLSRVFNIYQSVFLHKTDFLMFLWSVLLRGTCFLVLYRVFFCGRRRCLFCSGVRAEWVHEVLVRCRPDGMPFRVLCRLLELPLPAAGPVFRVFSINRGQGLFFAGLRSIYKTG